MENALVPKQNDLIKLIENSGLDQDQKNLMTVKFGEAFEIAQEWEEKACAIEVRDASETDLMQQAREGRLFLKEKRVAVEKTRKAMKESSLREGKAIDLIANTLKGLIEPIETYLEEQERFVELKEAREAAERAQRAEALLREQEAKDAADKAAREAAERERIRLENEQLRKEKAESERLRKETEQKASEDKRRADEKIRQEQAKTKQAEEAQRKAESDRKAAVERTRVIQERKNEEIKEVRSENAGLKKFVAHMITCPNCSHKFSWQNI